MFKGIAPRRRTRLAPGTLARATVPGGSPTFVRDGKCAKQSSNRFYMCRRPLYKQDVAPDPKTERFMIRMDANERRMLTELADIDGVSESSVIRQLIRRAYAERSKEQGRKKPKR